jgi:uncharacterized protein GlcG (DUF336 family)
MVVGGVGVSGERVMEAKEIRNYRGGRRDVFT